MVGGFKNKRSLHIMFSRGLHTSSAHLRVVTWLIASKWLQLLRGQFIASAEKTRAQCVKSKAILTTPTGRFRTAFQYSVALQLKSVAT